jgi:2,3-bisphosphoglycerate-dependent phosphoglycerate mutase
MKFKINVSALLVLIAIFSVSLFSCKSDADVKTDTNSDVVSDTVTTFILVRHAETAGIGSNPSLSTKGQNRANELVNVLGNVSLKAVFSTNYNRTTQTASPVAVAQSLTLQNYDPSALKAFVDTNILFYKGETILVVGHSNTTPDLLNILADSNLYSDIPEKEYDNMYTVSVDQKGEAKIVHAKYGQ